MEVEDGPIVHETPLGCTHSPRAEGNQVSIPIGLLELEMFEQIFPWKSPFDGHLHRSILLFRLETKIRLLHQKKIRFHRILEAALFRGHIMILLSDMIKCLVSHWMPRGTSFSCKHLQWQSEWEHEWEWTNHHLTFQLLTLHSFSTSPLKDHPHPHPPRRHPRLGSSVSESDSLGPKTSCVFFWLKEKNLQNDQQHFTVAACFFKPHLKKTCGNLLNDTLDPKSTLTSPSNLGNPFATHGIPSSPKALWKQRTWLAIVLRHHRGLLVYQRPRVNPETPWAPATGRVSSSRSTSASKFPIDPWIWNLYTVNLLHKGPKHPFSRLKGKAAEKAWPFPLCHSHSKAEDVASHEKTPHAYIHHPSMWIIIQLPPRLNPLPNSTELTRQNRGFRPYQGNEGEVKSRWTLSRLPVFVTIWVFPKIAVPQNGWWK